MALREEVVRTLATASIAKEFNVQDVIFVGLTIGFFAISILYTYACGKL
jgi:hypothetical protein